MDIVLLPPNCLRVPLPLASIAEIMHDIRAATDLQAYLDTTAALHRHLCPRQVLGVRAGMHAAELFDLPLPQTDKRLFAFVETDGCFADGVSVATGCWLGRRTLRLVDYGKVAATFVDTATGAALRVSPQLSARVRALEYAPGEPDSWHAQLAAYQVMPTPDLLRVEEVRLTVPLEEIISMPGLRVPCERCGEEIMNAREVLVGGRALCRRCAGRDSYYEVCSL
jgi:formylmethanofuran dehydrogenase subunit E